MLRHPYYLFDHVKLAVSLAVKCPYNSFCAVKTRHLVHKPTRRAEHQDRLVDREIASDLYVMAE
jgi:hypothetical protein